MTGRNGIADFLASRRAKITPEQAALPSFGSGHRRVPGLRREEVALLAGVSVDYYTRLHNLAVLQQWRGETDAALRSFQDALRPPA